MLPFGLSEYFELSHELFVSMGIPGLFTVAFLEFFLLPVPPDLVLIPLGVASPELVFLFAAVATGGSVAAGIVGYGIGHAGGRAALDSRFAGPRIDQAEAYFEQYGLVTVGVGAFAPIPEGYEILSVSAGAFGLDFRSYLVASLVGRGGRYFLEALLVLALGEVARALSEVQIYKIIGLVTIAILATYLLLRRWTPKQLSLSSR